MHLQQHKKGRIWVAYFLGVVCLAGGLGVYGYHWLETHGGLHDGFRGFLQAALSDEARGVTSTVEAAEFRFEFSATPVRLVARNVTLETRDMVLTLPSSEFGFSLFSWLRWDDGETPQDRNQASPQASSHFSPQVSMAFAALRHASITDARLVVKRSVSHRFLESEPLVFSPITLELERVDGGLSGAAVIENILGGSVRVAFSSHANSDSLDFDVDFGSVGFEVPRLGLEKASGASGRMTGRAVFADGVLRGLEGLAVKSDAFEAMGRVAFDDGGDFSAAFFERIAWSGNDISGIEVAPDAEGVYTLRASAETIDLRPLRRHESGADASLDAEVFLRLDLTAGHIVLDDEIALSGHVVLLMHGDGTESAHFLGTLFFSGVPFMTESSLKARFSRHGDSMHGRGLIGGAEASIGFSPLKNEGQKDGQKEGQKEEDEGGFLMLLHSDNGGQVLKTLGIVDAIRGGRLTMSAEVSDDYEAFDSRFDLEGFRVIEAPTAVRMMSVLSLAGLYTLLEGDGTYFDRGYARIESRDGRIFIHAARASGDALAVDFLGYIDSERRHLEISGMLLPFYGVTRFLGHVPLLGEVLTGVDNDGFLATQFSLEGAIDSPETSVNFSSIIPGLFRDVFSPNWLDKERRRLIPQSIPQAIPRAE